MSEEVAMAIADAPTIAQQAEQIAAMRTLFQQLLGLTTQYDSLSAESVAELARQGLGLASSATQPIGEFLSNMRIGWVWIIQ